MVAQEMQKADNIKYQFGTKIYRNLVIGEN